MNILRIIMALLGAMLPAAAQGPGLTLASPALAQTRFSASSALSATVPGMTSVFKASSLTGAANLATVNLWPDQHAGTPLSISGFGPTWNATDGEVLSSNEVNAFHANSLLLTRNFDQRNQTLLLIGRINQENGAASSTQIFRAGGGAVSVSLYGGTGVVTVFDGVTLKSSALKVPSGGRPFAILVTFGASALNIYVNDVANTATFSACAAVVRTDIELPQTFSNPHIETIIWDRVLTAPEITAALTYAQTTYGVVYLPTGSIVGRVTHHGDSTMFGQGDTLLKNELTRMNVAANWRPRVYRQSGRRIDECYASRVAAWDGLGPADWLFFLAAVNDDTAGATAATMIARWEQYWDAAIAANIGTGTGKRVAYTVSALSRTNAQAAELDAFNAYLRANAVSGGRVHYLVDLGADPFLGYTMVGPVWTPNNAAAWTDGVHYSDAGYAARAVKVRAEIPVPF